MTTTAPKKKITFFRKPAPVETPVIETTPEPVKKLSKKELYKEFNDLIRSIKYGEHTYNIFYDFIIVSTCAMRNSVKGIRPHLFSEEVEAEYFRVQKKYSNEDMLKFSHLYGLLVLLLEAHEQPYDVLGYMYMAHGYGNGNLGQFFTPPEVSDLMADMTVDVKSAIESKGYFTANDPACGSGTMMLSCVKKVITEGYNPLYTIYVEATDLDGLVARMCYLQLSLWGVPAKVIIGNSLTLEKRDEMYTPAYYLGNWDYKLKDAPTLKPKEDDVYQPDEDVA